MLETLLKTRSKEIFGKDYRFKQNTRDRSFSGVQKRIIQKTLNLRTDKTKRIAEGGSENSSQSSVGPRGIKGTSKELENISSSK